MDAAFDDPRFEPLGDLAGVHVEVSVLGPLMEFPAMSYDDVDSRLPRRGLWSLPSDTVGLSCRPCGSNCPRLSCSCRGCGARPGCNRALAGEVWTYEVEEFGRDVIRSGRR